MSQKAFLRAFDQAAIGAYLREKLDKFAEKAVCAGPAFCDDSSIRSKIMDSIFVGKDGKALPRGGQLTPKPATEGH